MALWIFSVTPLLCVPFPAFLGAFGIFGSFDSGSAFVACADAHGVSQRLNKDFAISEFACFQNFFSGFHHGFDRYFADNNFDFDLWQQVY